MASQDDRRSKDDARNAEREMRDALRLESFSLGGQNRLVKVIAIPTGGRVPPTVAGFVTQESFFAREDAGSDRRGAWRKSEFTGVRVYGVGTPERSGAVTD
jgi:hypothetical protein